MKYPKGTIVASDIVAYIKKYDVVERNYYWIGTEGMAWPFYGDYQVDKWITEGTHKVVRLGTDD